MYLMADVNLGPDFHVPCSEPVIVEAGLVIISWPPGLLS